jgi:hypothetical protein
VITLNKTKKIMIGVTATALTIGLVRCGTTNADLPPKPTDQSCGDWDWDDEDGVWECDDYSSGHYGHYYYGGTYYRDKSSLVNNNAYKSYKNSSSFKGGIKASSGFGSGTKVFGG